MSENIAARDRLPFERLRYWQGQMLRSRDLNDQLALDMEMRTWHNRAIHQAFGIIKGLEVAQVKEKGKRVRIEEGKLLAVKAGLAYDCRGREICLLRETKIVAPVEVAAGDWTLLIRCPAQSAVTEAVCCVLPPTSQTPELFWKPSRQTRPIDGVPLVAWRAAKPAKFGEYAAREADSDNPLSFAVDRSARVVARPEARPQIGYGATVQGQTAWQEWTTATLDWDLDHFSSRSRKKRSSVTRSPLSSLTAFVGGGSFGVETTIDTSTFGFTESPCYFAWVRGHPMQPQPTVTIGRITQSRRDSFTYSVLILAARELGLNFALRHLYVCWLGIECLSPCTSTEEVDDGRPC